MLKIKTRFISVVMAVAVTVTAAFGGAMSAAAATIAELALPYTIGTTISDELTDSYDNNTYSFVLKDKSDITAHLIGTGFTGYYNISLFYQLLDSNGNRVAPLKYNPVQGYDTGRQLNRGSEATGIAETNLQYKNLLPGTYYFKFCVTSGAGNGYYFELTTTAVAITSPFVAGSVAPNVAAANVSGGISVSWGAVTSAQYAVYYTYKSNATGAFGNWGIASASTNSYTIANPVKNATYYITILPYSNVPSRQYGGFSPYAQVRT